MRRRAGAAVLTSAVLLHACHGGRGVSEAPARPSSPKPAVTAVTRPSPTASPPQAAALPWRGDVQDFLVRHLASTPVLHAFTGASCEPLSFRPALTGNDASFGVASFRGKAYEYWVDVGFLAFKGNRVLKKDRLALRGVTEVSFLAGAGELFRDAEACERHGSRGAPIVVGDSSNGESLSVERIPEVRPAFEPVLEYLAHDGALFWPTLTSKGIACQKQQLTGSAGRTAIASGQISLGHAYSHDRMGIRFSDPESLPLYTTDHAKPGAYVIGGPPRQLAVHGRDEVSFFVDGSRWFFRADDCERFKDTARPLELEFVGRATSYLSENPRIRGPVTRPLPRVDLNGRYRADPANEPGVCDEVVLEWRSAGYMGGPDRGLLTVKGAMGLRAYDYELYLDPRGIWLSERGDGTDRMRGEFRYIRSFDVKDRAVQVGAEVWYGDAGDCARASARLAAPR